jgi:microcystin-dependent protein
MFAGSFAPVGWAKCDGQLLAVSQNDALFSLYGTIYGGDGRTTFGLPDLRGRIPVHAGTPVGGSPIPIGRRAGVERVTVTANQVPAHTHVPQTTGEPATDRAGANAVLAQASVTNFYDSPPPFPPPVVMDPAQIASSAGGSQTHDNMQPFRVLCFIVALFGTFPSMN